MIKRISAFFLSAWLALAFGSAGLNSNQQAGFGVTALNGFNAFGCRADFFLGAAILGSGESVSMSGYQGKIKLGGSLGTGKTLMIPRGCNRMNIKAWGAGGTGGGADTSGGVSDGGNGGNGGGGGDRNRFFGGEPNPDAEALQKAIEAKAPAEEVKAKLAKYRESRKAKEAKLAQAQDELRKVLSVRQEASAVLAGLLQ